MGRITGLQAVMSAEAIDSKGEAVVCNPKSCEEGIK